MFVPLATMQAGFAPMLAGSASRAALLADAAAAFVRLRVGAPPLAAGRRSSAPMALPAADALAAAQRYAAQLSSAGAAHAATKPPPQQQQPAASSPMVVLDNLAAPHELDASLEACVLRRELARGDWLRLHRRLSRWNQLTHARGAAARCARSARATAPWCACRWRWFRPPRSSAPLASLSSSPTQQLQLRRCVACVARSAPWSLQPLTPRLAGGGAGRAAVRRPPRALLAVRRRALRRRRLGGAVMTQRVTVQLSSPAATARRRQRSAALRCDGSASQAQGPHAAFSAAPSRQP